MPFTETAQLLGNLWEFAGAIAIVVTPKRRFRYPSKTYGWDEKVC